MNENLFEPIELLAPLTFDMDALIYLDNVVKCDKGIVCKVGTSTIDPDDPN
jgi:hypothetical protein